MFALQGSLLDQEETLGLRDLGRAVRRTELSRGAWVDVRPGWLTGADDLLARLLPGGSAGVDWRTERRRMYDREVDTPRLLRFYSERERWPEAILYDARDALSTHYRPELAEPFVTAGMCLYRDGSDSVAWHGDREGRAATQDTCVAIVSVGAPRDLLMRPAGGGASLRFSVGHGDLVVMGGSHQRTWEHAVPKTTRNVGPRVSVQFRTAGVR